MSPTPGTSNTTTGWGRRRLGAWNPAEEIVGAAQDLRDTARAAVNAITNGMPVDLDLLRDAIDEVSAALKTWGAA